MPETVNSNPVQFWVLVHKSPKLSIQQRTIIEMACGRGKHSFWFLPGRANDLFLLILRNLMFLKHLYGCIINYNLPDAHGCFRRGQEVVAGHIGQRFVYENSLIFEVNFIPGQSQGFSTTKPCSQQ